MEITRYEYEELIRPLLLKTLTCLDQALSDAKVQANQIDKVVLVGGATRTPLVHRLLEERLGRPVHCEIEPDLAVAMGAAVQGGLIAGIDVGPILVDITPHTLGIECSGRAARVPVRRTHSRRSSSATRRCPPAGPRSTRRSSTNRTPRGSGSSRARTRTRATTPWSASS